MGRPTSYNQEVADALCAELAEGLSLRKVCQAEGMPDKSTVFRWLRIHPEFCDQYARAKQESADALVDEMLDIADNGLNDWVEGEEGGDRYNGDHVQRSRLRVETRKWVASKLKPKRYGDKVTQEVSGPDGNPVEGKITIELVRAHSDS